MGIQAMSTTSTVSSGTAVSSGSAGQASATSAPGNETSFALILGGQQTADASAQSIGNLVPDEQTTSLIGLVQMLQTLMSPVQSQLLAGANAEQQGTTLPELLLQAISDPSKLSDQLLQDPNLGQWLAQASALLPTLPIVGSNSFTANASMGMKTADPNVAAKLSAQQTLLQFAAALRQMPDNPIVHHLVAELQSAVEPVLSNLVPTHAADASAKLPTGADKPVVAANPAGASLLPVTDQIVVSSVTVQSGPDAGLQQTKAKLEMLAAKSGGLITAVQHQLSSNAPDQGSADSSSEDNASSFQTPTMPLQDLLKTLQQAPLRPETQTTVHASTFVRDMSEYMANNMKLSVGELFKEAKLSLHPEHLGQIDVKITLHANGQIVAQLTADTMAGKQLLESQLPQLRQALQNQGLQIERLEVAQEQAASSSMFQQSRQQGGGGQPSEQEPRGNASENDAVDAEFANDLRTLADLRSEEGGSSGGSFDASA